MGKKWYKVSFFAEMSEADVKAMQGSFFAAMEESMEIYGCEGLKIESEKDDEQADIVLEEDSYILDKRTGRIQIDKQIFDDFKKDHYIDIKFIDEDHEPINRYIMVEEDDEWIHCDFLETIR